MRKDSKPALSSARLLSPADSTIVGVATAPLTDSLRLTDVHGGPSVVVAQSMIAELDRNADKRRRWAEGAWIGAFAGMGTGLLVGGLTTKEDPCPECSEPVPWTCSSASCRMPVGALLGAVGGGLVGAMVGGFVTTDRWVRVPLRSAQCQLLAAPESRTFAARFVWYPSPLTFENRGESAFVWVGQSQVVPRAMPLATWWLAGIRRNT